nr:hypothetical protein B0A51_08566 [Rachicladosporium sp. CCFEE 5018]
MPGPSSIPAKRPAAPDAAEAAWVADEDRFVLQQARKKAAIRVKSGRAAPIDWLVVTLALTDPDRDALDDDLEGEEFEAADPEGVFEGLSEKDLSELEKAIEGYVVLEKGRREAEYWDMMRTICRDRRKHSQSVQTSARGVTSVKADLDKLLGPKDLEGLEKLERQIKTKLSSNEPIDTDYWEHLLSSLLVYKARAKLRKVSQSIKALRVGGLRGKQVAEADALKVRLQARAQSAVMANGDDQISGQDQDSTDRHDLDPEPLLRLRPEDKQLAILTPAEFAKQLETDRETIKRHGLLPNHKRSSTSTALEPAIKRQRTDDPATSAATQPTTFDRELARGLADNEEILTSEVEVVTKSLPRWLPTSRPRKPQSFNRLLLGYDWNKYNQTHYTTDAPPPKVVQGYRFNIFYPDLPPGAPTPTYKIEREDGRRRGEVRAEAGEEDMCTIRFVGGEPYLDVAWRIVDREWDFSAKRERGFRSSFDKGVLQVWFLFKRVYYRK